MKTMIHLFLLSVTVSASAQVSADVAPSGQTRDGAVVFYGSDNFNKKIPYGSITGIPYWRNDYYPAQVYGPMNSKYGLMWVRVNLATHEVEYVAKNEDVQAAGPDQVSKVVIVDPKDSTRIMTIFRSDIGEINVHYMKDGRLYYAQELNQGPVKLIKITHRDLKAGDSMLRTMKRYYFVDRADYFIQHANRVERLKRLEKDEIMKYLPRTPELEAYLDKNKIVFKKEEDVLKLLEVYNQKNSVQ